MKKYKILAPIIFILVLIAGYLVLSPDEGPTTNAPAQSDQGIRINP